VTEIRRMKRALTPTDYRSAAQSLQCEIAALRAVAEVEAPMGGFLADGRLRVLFEGHVFHRQTGGKFAESHPTLCFPKWTREHYARGKDADERGAGELARLEAAMALDRRAALCSASYGKFQIMGLNHRSCAYPDVDSFYNGMRIDEQAQLDAFCHFIKANGMVQALRDLDWTKFARLYNGPGFRSNDYDGKLASAYQNLGRAEAPIAARATIAA
jgi:hypothetical protein